MYLASWTSSDDQAQWLKRLVEPCMPIRLISLVMLVRLSEMIEPGISYGWVD